MDVRAKTSPLLAQTFVLLFVFIVVGIALTKAPASSGRAGAQEAPQSQSPERSVVRKPWRVEAIEIVAVKTKNKENIEIGRTFDEDDDWLDGFTVTVFNNYHKTVTAMTIRMVFRREPGDTRPPMAMNLHFGPSPIAREYIHRDPNKVVKVGKTADLVLSSSNYKILKQGFEQTGYPKRISRVELVITEVGFEDGSVFDSGSFYLQDPASPNDPTKKIPVPEPGGQNQRIRSPPVSKEIFTNAAFLRASLTLPTSLPLSLTVKPLQSECGPKSFPIRTSCSEECSVRRDTTDPFLPGTWMTQFEFEHCEDLWESDGEYHTCGSFTVYQVQRFVQCEIPVCHAWRLLFRAQVRWRTMSVLRSAADQLRSVLRLEY